MHAWQTPCFPQRIIAMALTLGTTGMDSKTEAEVQAAFKAANAETGNQWTLVEGDEADYVVVDMDSLYGPMSWLRLHAAGRKVIGLTSVDRNQTDHRLPRPISADDFTVLLSEIAVDAPVEAAAKAAAAAAAAPAPKVEPAASKVEAAVQPDPEPEPEPVPVVEPDPIPEPEPEPEPEPVIALPEDRGLARWLLAGGLERRVRLQRGDGPVLLVDPRTRVWHGPATLKPLASYFEGDLQLEDFATPDAGPWESEAAAIGPAQPLSRLQWLGGLLAGRGALLPGLDPDGKYRLLKWPQTEREYPKHFRIATAMMKGPASVSEVAEASGVAKEDVADFVNANLATGYAESTTDAPPDPDATANKPAGGLFGRMRGR
jgi:hypothetical protein